MRDEPAAREAADPLDAVDAPDALTAPDALPTGEDPRAALREQIERDEHELGRAIAAFRATTRAELSLGAHVARHPAPWVVGAFAIGFWIGWGSEPLTSETHLW